MDFEAELAKFQPSLEIDQAEDAIYGNNTTDVTDLLQSILKDEKAEEIQRKINQQDGWKNNELSKMQCQCSF